jgi:hypothetical protein
VGGFEPGKQPGEEKPDGPQRGRLPNLPGSQPLDDGDNGNALTM